MRAYLTQEAIETLGTFIFRIKMFGLGGKFQTIGPFSMKIIERAAPLVFPTHLINPNEGLSVIEV
jgi:hypothetical protein